MRFPYSSNDSFRIWTDQVLNPQIGGTFEPAWGRILCRLARDPEPRIRTFALRVLAEEGPNTPFPWEIMEALVLDILSGIPEDFHAEDVANLPFGYAIHALSLAPETTALAELKRLSRHPSRTIRHEAACAAAGRRRFFVPLGEAFVELLTAMARDPDLGVSHCALDVLREDHSLPADAVALYQRLAASPDDEYFTAAVVALRGLGIRVRSTPERVAALSERWLDWYPHSFLEEPTHWSLDLAKRLVEKAMEIPAPHPDPFADLAAKGWQVEPRDWVSVDRQVQLRFAVSGLMLAAPDLDLEPALSQWCTDTFQPCREAGAVLLGLRGERGQNILQGFQGSQGPELRRLAVMGLAADPGPIGRTSLEALLDSEQCDQRQDGLTVLHWLSYRDPAAWAALALIRSEPEIQEWESLDRPMELFPPWAGWEMAGIRTFTLDADETQGPLARFLREARSRSYPELNGIVEDPNMQFPALQGCLSLIRGSHPVIRHRIGVALDHAYLEPPDQVIQAQRACLDDPDPAIRNVGYRTMARHLCHAPERAWFEEALRSEHPRALDFVPFRLSRVNLPEADDLSRILCRRSDPYLHHEVLEYLLPHLPLEERTRVLLQMVAMPDPTYYALSFLLKNPLPECLPGLIASFPTSRRPDEILAVMGASQDPRALEFLLRLTPSPGNREALVAALASFSTAEASMAIARILDEPDPPDDTGIHLATTGTLQAFEELVRHLRSSSMPHRIHAIEGLSLHPDPRGLDHLCACLDDHDPLIRQHALRNLGNRHEPEVPDLLWPHLSAEDPEDRHAAGLSLPGLPEELLEATVRVVLDLPSYDPFAKPPSAPTRSLGRLLQVGHWLAGLAKEGLLPADPPWGKGNVRAGTWAARDDSAVRSPGAMTQRRSI